MRQQSKHSLISSKEYSLGTLSSLLSWMNIATFFRRQIERVFSYKECSFIFAEWYHRPTPNRGANWNPDLPDRDQNVTMVTSERRTQVRDVIEQNRTTICSSTGPNSIMSIYLNQTNPNKTELNRTNAIFACVQTSSISFCWRRKRVSFENEAPTETGKRRSLHRKRSIQASKHPKLEANLCELITN